MAGGETIRDLLVRLGVDADTAEVKRFDTALGTARRGMLAAAGIAATLAGAIFGVAVATARQGDESAKAAQRLGITAEEMQELSFAAEQAGADMAAVEVALRRQAASASDAAEGSSTAAKAYDDLGVSATNAEGKLKAPLVLFEELSEEFSKLTNETQKSALMNDIWGRGGAKLGPLANQGAEGIRALRQQARDLGFVMSNEAAKSAEEFNDRLNELRKMAAGLRNRIGIGLMPVLTNMIERFRDWFLTNRQFIDQKIDEAVDRIRYAIERARDAFAELDRRVTEGLGGWDVAFKQVMKILSTAGILGALRVLIPVVTAVITIISGFATVTAVVFTALGAAILGALLIAEDFVVFLRGGKSVVGDWFASFERADEVRAAFQRLSAAVGGFLDALGAKFQPVIDAVASLIDKLGLWELAAKGVDVIMLGLILAFETAMTGAADFIEVATLALTDFDALLAEVFGRLSEFATTIEGMADKIGNLAKKATPLAALTGGPMGYVSNLASRYLAQETGGRAGAAGRVAGAISERFGPRPELQGPAVSTVVINQEGDTISIPTTADANEIVQILERRSVQRRQQAMAATRGGER